MKISGIYMVSIPSEEVAYIGCSTDIKKRFSTHMSNMKKELFAYESFNTGWKNNTVKFEILEECSVDDLQEREQYYIDYMQRVGFKVVNQRKAGKLPFNSDEAKKNKSDCQRGSGNGNAKLTQSQVDKIRKLHSGGMGIQELHERFKVSCGHIRNILSGRSWTEC